MKTLKTILSCIGAILILIIFFYAIMMSIVSDDIDQFIKEEVKYECEEKPIF